MEPIHLAATAEDPQQVVAKIEQRALRLSALLREIDTVVYVAAGRAAAGRTDEIIQSDVLSALYGSRVDVLHVNGRVLVIAGEEQQEPQAHHPAETGVVVGLDRT